MIELPSSAYNFKTKNNQEIKEKKEQNLSKLNFFVTSLDKTQESCVSKKSSKKSGRKFKIVGSLFVLESTQMNAETSNSNNKDVLENSLKTSTLPSDYSNISHTTTSTNNDRNSKTSTSEMDDS